MRAWPPNYGFTLSNAARPAAIVWLAGGRVRS
jgi:hypothetical protein